VRDVIAIEMYCAAQAMDFRKPHRPGKGTEPAYRKIREYVPFLENDRPLFPDMNKIAELVRNNEILEAVEKAVGEVKLRGWKRPE